MNRNQIRSAAAELLRGNGRNISSFDKSQLGLRKVDHFNPPVTNGKANNSMQILSSYGNPVFDAQFDVSVSIRYFTEAAGVYTAVAAGAIVAALRTKLAAFIFGHTDQASGYAKIQGQYPVTGGWLYGDLFVYGRDLARSNFSNLDATAKAVLQKGDVVMPFYATTAGPVNTVGLVIIRSSSVPFADLINALSSDIFYTNMIRYTIADALVAQFNNAIGVYNLSLFGKFLSDSINPNAFKNPEQNQVGIIDMATVQGIDKNIAWALYVNYDAVDFVLQIFANGVDKLKAV